MVFFGSGDQRSGSLYTLHILTNWTIKQTCNIIDTKDIIKVEVWDVVDKGVQTGDLKGPSSGSALKIENSTRKLSGQVLGQFYFF